MCAAKSPARVWCHDVCSDSWECRGKKSGWEETSGEKKKRRRRLPRETWKDPNYVTQKFRRWKYASARLCSNVKNRAGRSRNRDRRTPVDQTETVVTTTRAGSSVFGLRMASRLPRSVNKGKETTVAATRAERGRQRETNEANGREEEDEGYGERVAERARAVIEKNERELRELERGFAALLRKEKRGSGRQRHSASVVRTRTDATSATIEKSQSPQKPAFVEVGPSGRTLFVARHDAVVIWNETSGRALIVRGPSSYVLDPPESLLSGADADLILHEEICAADLTELRLSSACCADTVSVPCVIQAHLQKSMESATVVPLRGDSRNQLVVLGLTERDIRREMRGLIELKDEGFVGADFEPRIAELEAALRECAP